MLGPVMGEHTSGCNATEVRKASQRRTLPTERKVGAPSPNESPNLHPVFLGERWNDAVQAQVLDQLSVVVGDVPDGNNSDAEFGVRSGVTAFDTVESIVRRKRGEDAVGVVEGVLEIFDKLGL